VILDFVLDRADSADIGIPLEQAHLEPEKSLDSPAIPELLSNTQTASNTFEKSAQLTASNEFSLASIGNFD
jgi:hypothetical protein